MLMWRPHGRTHARESGHPDVFEIPGFRLAPAIASLAGMTPELFNGLGKHHSSIFYQNPTLQESLCFGWNSDARDRFFQLLSTVQTVWYSQIVKTISSFRLALFGLTLCFGLMRGIASASADQIEEIKQEQTKARRQEQINEIRRQEQIETLKRDQQLNQAQQQLDQLKQQKVDPAGAQQPQAQQTQQQLDQIKNELQIKRLQNELQFNQIQREQNQSRQQEQIRELQRQQQMEFLQDQNHKNQMQLDLDRLRQQP